MRRTLLPLLCSLFVISASPGQEVVEEIVDAPESGFRLAIPDIGWGHEQQKDSNGLTTVAVGPRERGGLVQLSIQTTTVGDSSIEAARAQIAELRGAVAADQSITRVDDYEYEIAGHTAPGLIVAQTARGNDFLVHLVFLRVRGMQYRIQFHAPKDEFAEQWALAEQVLAGFQLVELDAATQERTRLQRLAARCGSQVDWVRDWDEAAKLAREQGRLVVVAIHAIPGFAIGDPLNETIFTDDRIVPLVGHRFVALRWSAGMPAPFVSHEVFGLSGSTFGSGLLVCTPAGDVVRQIYLVDNALVGDALRDALLEYAPLAPAPHFEGDDRSDHVAYLIDSGQLDRARAMLAEPVDEPDDGLAYERARLHRVDRDGASAMRALARCPESAAVSLMEATVRMRMGDLEGSVPALARCLAQDPDAAQQAEARLLQGLLAWADGDVDGARAKWTRLTQDLPEQPAAWMAAAALVGPALELGVEPDLSWPSAAAIRFSRLPRAARQSGLDVDQALHAAVEWLLSSQQPDGAWETLFAERSTAPAPDPVTMASHAIAITALRRVADSTDDAALEQRCREAVRAGVERYLANRALGRASPNPVAFMDYTCWGSSYGLLCMCEVTPGASVGQDALREEAEDLIRDLVRIQQANGGWSYYLSGDVGGEAAIVAMSFTTATVLLALDTARSSGFEVPDGVLERGRARLASMRGPNGNFEYMRMGTGSEAATAVAPAGAAARGPVCTQALQHGGLLDESAMQPSFETYIAHLPGYGTESRKALMHPGPAGQGSHYLLYDYSTAAHAMRTAQLDGRTRRAARAAILRELARCRSADGSFIDNPLIGPVAGTGLAVLTLLDLM